MTPKLIIVLLVACTVSVLVAALVIWAMTSPGFAIFIVFGVFIFAVLFWASSSDASSVQVDE